jgi:hypothetical protein
MGWVSGSWGRRVARGQGRRTRSPKARTAGSLTNVGSWDATGSATIQVTAAGSAFARPNGSGNGIKALSRSIDGTPYNLVNITGQLDYARSSRGPAAGGDLAGGALTFVPIARDAVTYASNGIQGNLTVAQLSTIYTAPTAAGAVVGGVQTFPTLPSVGSGTRAFFLGAIGVTEAQVGAFVTQGVQENTADGIADTAGKVVPFSAASWIAQFNGAAPSHIATAIAAGTTLGTPLLDGLGASVPATMTNGTKIAPNPPYYGNATFGRDVYTVVQTTRLSSGLPDDASLVAQFAGPGAAVASVASDTIVQTFGFQAVDYAGDTDIVGFGDIAGDHAKGGALE